MLIHRALIVLLEELNFLVRFALETLRRKSEFYIFEKILQRFFKFI